MINNNRNILQFIIILENVTGLGKMNRVGTYT